MMDANMDLWATGEVEMGDMDMGDGVPTPYVLQRIYWSFVGAIIVAAAAVNLFQRMICWQRLQAARKGLPTPAKPKRIWMVTLATMTAICREINYATITSRQLQRLVIQLPTAGEFLIAAAQLVLVLVLCFVNLSPKDAFNWENLAFRTGYIATAQLPLIFILSGKVNLIGLLTGVGYERLNWLHRWTARVLFVTVTTHMILWFEDWAQFGYIVAKLQNDSVTQKGLAAWVILFWIFLSSFRSLRWLSHEFFVIQHLVTIAGFSATVYLHLPDDMKYVLWISVAFAIFDRAARSSNILVQNTSFVCGNARALGYGARLEKLPGGVTRITIDNPKLSWKPGQHIFMALHSIAPLQSHPFTIASLPSDGKLSFIVKAHQGATMRIYKKVSEELPTMGQDIFHNTKSTIIEGPYGRIRPLQQFDSIVFLAGSTGAAFTLPLMRDLVQRCTGRSSTQPRLPHLYDGCVTNHIKFVWVIKAPSHLLWFMEELNNAMSLIEECSRDHRIELSISVYVTCDETLGKRGNLSVGQCLNVSTKTDSTTQTNVKIVGATHSCDPHITCCCTNIVEEDDESGRQSCHCTCDTFENRGTTIVTETNANEAHSLPEISTSTSVAERSSSGPSNTVKSPQQIRLRSSIDVVNGRPNVRSVIRNSLEQARGESAVVVCGPSGLITDARASVTSLSDERAVHKGTGAQGIYLHTEHFRF